MNSRESKRRTGDVLGEIYLCLAVQDADAVVDTEP
jgi:hypothetical protein